VRLNQAHKSFTDGWDEPRDVCALRSKRTCIVVAGVKKPTRVKQHLIACAGVHAWGIGVGYERGGWEVDDFWTGDVQLRAQAEKPHQVVRNIRCRIENVGSFHKVERSGDARSPMTDSLSNKCVDVDGGKPGVMRLAWLEQSRRYT
jgi:hypothetical protein